MASAEWLMTRCRAMGCREEETWTDQYGNRWCDGHGEPVRRCPRLKCSVIVERVDEWCSRHEYRQEVIRLANRFQSPMLTLPDGRVIPPGSPMYGVIARSWSDETFALVMGALALLGREFC